MSKSILFISNVWPEPTTTAASRRTLSLIEFYIEQEYIVHFYTTFKLRNTHSEYLDTLGVVTTLIEINDSSFNDLLKSLAPEQVVFDRFMIEEQFGWRVKDICPDAIRILDTSDLHFLRIQRGEELNQKSKSKAHEIKLRELASIYRSDISLVISKIEHEKLIEIGVPKSVIHYLPFVVETPDPSLWRRFEDRADFMTIGSFLHEPNTDSILYFKKEIWPLIRKQLPNVKMHVYGAYCKPKHEQWTNKKDDFYIHGFAEDSLDVISTSKVLVAPLRFGAGLKGKLLEGMLTGTPSVTTSIGCEGMVDELSDWPGSICDDPISFANACVELYNEKKVWSVSSLKSVKCIDLQFSIDGVNGDYLSFLNDYISKIETIRSNNIIGEMLNYHTMRSTKFMSQWIEAKNKLTN